MALPASWSRNAAPWVNCPGRRACLGDRGLVPLGVYLLPELRLRLRPTLPFCSYESRCREVADHKSRPVLSRRERSLATIAMMTALGNEFAIREHVIMGLDSFGLSREEICEVMIQAAIYAGFPAAMQAFEIATDVFAQRDAAA